jgi:hypothetical protein
MKSMELLLCFHSYLYTARLCTLYWCFSIKGKIELDESVFYLFLISSLFAITFLSSGDLGSIPEKADWALRQWGKPTHLSQEPRKDMPNPLMSAFLGSQRENY